MEQLLGRQPKNEENKDFYSFFLLFVVSLISLKLYFSFMLVFVSIFQGVEAESIEDFIKPKLQTKLKDAELII